MAYRLSEAAGEDIDFIVANGIVEFGVEQARRYHGGLFRLFELLSNTPYMARERLEISPPVRIHPYKSHVVIYKIEEVDIFIIRVCHAREDWMSGFLII